MLHAPPHALLLHSVPAVAWKPPPGLQAALLAALGGDSSSLLLGDAAAAAGDRDWSAHPACPPWAVALPSSADEVASVVKACVLHATPFVPRGAGTGVEGGAVAYSGGVVVDTSRLKSVNILPGAMQAVVGAGVLKLELAKACSAHGLLFGPDPSSNPSVGGMASTAGSGMTTLKYGTTRENVVSLLVVTPQGELLRTRTPVRKSSTGLELTQLYLGAEGTLGLIVELTLRLFPAHAHRTGAAVPFPHVGAAASAVVALLRQQPHSLLRCELLNAEGVVATNSMYPPAAGSAGAPLDPLPTLFVEFTGDDPAALEAEARAAVALLRRGGGLAPRTATGDGLDGLWAARRGCYYAAFKTRGPQPVPERVLITDVCVPLARLPELVGETEADFRARGIPCIICAHAADGNIHALAPYQPHEAAAVRAAEHALIDRALRLGGTVSGEHGVGVGKIEHCAREHGPVHIDCQRRIKFALDPLNLCNPGKMLPALGHHDAGAGGANALASRL